MTKARLDRISGMALIAGALAFIAHIVARSVLTAGVEPTAFAQHAAWVPVNVLGLCGAVLVLFGLPAVVARLAGTAGTLGLVGFVLLAASWLFGVFLSLYAILVAPWLAERAPSLVGAEAPAPVAFLVAFGSGLLAQLVGTVLLSVGFLRGGVQPRWVAYLLPAAALMTIVGDLAAPTGPAANLAINLLSNLGPMVLMAALGTLGRRMLVGEPDDRALPGPSMA